MDLSDLKDPTGTTDKPAADVAVPVAHTSHVNGIERSPIHGIDQTTIEVRTVLTRAAQAIRSAPRTIADLDIQLIEVQSLRSQIPQGSPFRADLDRTYRNLLIEIESRIDENIVRRTAAAK